MAEENEYQKHRHTRYVVEAAGGNATVIRVLDTGLTIHIYAKDGRAMMSDTEDLGVEQAGFLVLKDLFFAMSGGEFCGNAARAAAMLLSRITGRDEVTFRMTGVSGPVQGLVEWISKSEANVTCTFEGLNPKIFVAKPKDMDLEATVVDLGGIVHILLKGEMPADKPAYEQFHKQIREALSLDKRDAVGVCWINEKNGAMHMDPVVWVRSIDTCFYEGACGSGSIATALASDNQRITQPTGKVITVRQEGNLIVISSHMEIIDER